jgi:hypothetical protein
MATIIASPGSPVHSKKELSGLTSFTKLFSAEKLEKL